MTQLLPHMKNILIILSVLAVIFVFIRGFYYQSFVKIDYIIISLSSFTVFILLIIKKKKS